MTADSVGDGYACNDSCVAGLPKSRRGSADGLMARTHATEKLAQLPKLGSTNSGIPDDEKATEQQSVFNMVNAIMGAGVLGFPFCYKSCGMVLATLLILINVFASEMSLRLLVLSSHLTNRRTYEELAYITYGNLGQRLVDCCVVVVNMGSLVAYVNILADVWSAVAGTIIPPGAEPSRNVMMTVITLLGALPIALFVRSPQLLSFLSQATVGYIFVFGCVICGMAFSSVTDWGQFEWWRIEGIGVSFSVIAYGFTAHQVMFAIYRSLRAPSVKRMNGVIARSMNFCAVLYCMVGAAGYMLFKQRTSGDLLRNLGGAAATGAWGAYQRALKLGYGMAVLGTIPLVIIPFYTTARPLVAMAQDGQPARSLTPAEQQQVSVVVIVVALLIAMTVPNVELIFALTGATASMLLAYVMPAAMYLRILESRRGIAAIMQEPPQMPTVCGLPLLRFHRRVVVALLVFGLTMAVVCTRSTLMAVHQEKQVAQLATQLAVNEAKVIKTKELEQRAKQVAAAVDVVNQATKQLDDVQRQASDALGAVKQAAQRIQQHDRWHPAGVGQDTRELDNVQAHVTTTIETLQNVTNALTHTAEQLRNSTSKAGKKQDRRREPEGSNDGPGQGGQVSTITSEPLQGPQGQQTQTDTQTDNTALPGDQQRQGAVNGAVEHDAAGADVAPSPQAAADSVPALLDKVLNSAIDAKKVPVHDAATAERALEVAKELGEQLAQRKETTPEVVIDHEMESTASTLNQVAALATKSLTTVKETAAALNAVRQMDANTSAGNSAGDIKPSSMTTNRNGPHTTALVVGSEQEAHQIAAETAMQQLVNATQTIQEELDDSLQQLKTVQATREAELVKHQTGDVSLTPPSAVKTTAVVLSARKAGDTEVAQPIMDVQTTI